MRISTLAINAAAFALGLGLCYVAAGFAVNVIEDNSERGVRRALDQAALPWAEVEAEGLQVRLHGTAPTEAQRFKAVSTAATVVDAARVIDRMEILATKGIAPPRFSIEMLRNDAGVSLIGLVPATTNRAELVARLRSQLDGVTVADLLESADYPTPDGWDSAVEYAIDAMAQLKRAKISVAADQVAITATSASADARRKLEAQLARSAPSGLRLALAISAPRPVITPFTLRFIKDSSGARFDACSADTPESRAEILQAASAAGLEGKADCTLGLGVPSPNWGDAVAQSIATLAEIGGGSLTFADADITLVAPQDTDQAVFDRAIGHLENSLPDVFALNAVLQRPKANTASETPEFVATLSPEGLVQMRGRLRSELGRSTAETFAKARFDAAKVYNGARLDQNLPADWPVRVLAGLGALAQLSNGALVVSPDLISISGNTGNPDASATIARMLVDKLGDAQRLSINVTYQEALDPIASLPTPAECESQITEILKTRKINFEPGSSNPVAEAGPVLDDIAEVLKTCGEVTFEIGGHTDSQGREEMNQQLSQARAQAVLGELRIRRVLNPNITAMGYGEAAPIADNGTEEGRETNRRIEFKLITPAPIPEVATTLESAEQDLPDQAADPAADPAATPQTQDADEPDAQTLAPEDAGAEQGSNDE